MIFLKVSNIMNTFSEAIQNACGFFSLIWGVGKIQSLLMKPK